MGRKIRIQALFRKHDITKHNGTVQNETILYKSQRACHNYVVMSNGL